MDSLQDILSRYSQPSEPAEAVAIRQYIDETFSMAASVVVQEATVIITVTCAALANALRLRHHELQPLAGLSRKIIFRIG